MRDISVMLVVRVLIQENMPAHLGINVQLVALLKQIVLQVSINLFHFKETARRVRRDTIAHLQD